MDINISVVILSKLIEESTDKEKLINSIISFTEDAKKEFEKEVTESLEDSLLKVEDKEIVKDLIGMSHKAVKDTVATAIRTKFHDAYEFYMYQLEKELLEKLK